MTRVVSRMSGFAAMAALMVVASAGSASAANLTVPGTANLFGAGHSAAPGTGCSFRGGPFAGSIPPSVSFPAGSGQVVTFSSVTGTVKVDGPASASLPPDGDPAAGSNIDSTAGIAAVDDNDDRVYLAGVFLTGAEPTGAAPASLDFGTAGLGKNFTTVAPLVAQSFFIGDGRNAAGAVQSFQVPAGATRLFLGFEDALGYVGSPGCYDDNSGELAATFAVPGCEKAKKKKKKKGKKGAATAAKKKKKKKKGCKKKKKKKKKK